MLVFRGGVPLVMNKHGRNYVVCNGGLGDEEYPGAMYGDLVYGNRTTTGCGTPIDVTDVPNYRPESGCGADGHGRLPEGAAIPTAEEWNREGA